MAGREVVAFADEQRHRFGANGSGVRATGSEVAA
jgi:hypothetical protein